VDIEAAARRWAEVWSRAWPRKDAESIVALYSDQAVYRALAFREPKVGLDGVRSYLKENFDVEGSIRCWFGQPVVHANRAAVEWWGSWFENGGPLTLAGTSVLTFDPNGRVVDQRDYWNQVDRITEPYPEWRSEP